MQKKGKRKTRRRLVYEKKRTGNNADPKGKEERGKINERNERERNTRERKE